ncbi:four helix bundle protein [Chryseobacterium sp. G0186]|nr:four helix bundle protein [Chryseobacterium sp. G0186]
MANCKDLLVWQKSIDFVTEIYKIAEFFPKSEMYGLISHSYCRKKLEEK